MKDSLSMGAARERVENLEKRWEFEGNAERWSRWRRAAVRECGKLQKVLVGGRRSGGAPLPKTATVSISPFYWKGQSKRKVRRQSSNFRLQSPLPFFQDFFFSFFLSLSWRNLKYINYDFYIMRKIKFLMVKLQGLIIHFEI